MCVQFKQNILYSGDKSGMTNHHDFEQDLISQNLRYVSGPFKAMLILFEHSKVTIHRQLFLQFSLIGIVINFTDMCVISNYKLPLMSDLKIYNL